MTSQEPPRSTRRLQSPTPTHSRPMALPGSPCSSSPPHLDQAHKMEEWLTILLGEMNFGPDKEVAILFRGARSRWRRSSLPPDRPKSEDETVRFQ